MTETTTDDTCARMTCRAWLKHVPGVLPDAKAHLTFWSLMVGGLALDLWTKKAVFDWLRPGERYPVLDSFLEFVPALNNGAAFGWFSGRVHFLIAISIGAVIVILAVFLFSGNRQRLVHVALGLLAAGVCGNLYDRIFNGGSVRDFVDVYYRNFHWHTFNVADSLLCLGVVVLIISTFTTGKPDRKRDQQQK
ncbi:MAG: signal peptidase II [Sedimentisphaerales bacterium]